MQARYVQKGDSIDYTPASDITAGDVIVIADLIGVAKLDIRSGELGALAVVGVFDVIKGTGEIRAGATVYWDAGAQKATTVVGSNHYLGKAITMAEANSETVRILLNAPYSLATTFVAGDSITDLVDTSGGTPSDTLPPISCDCKDAIASLARKTNTILAALRAVGIIAAE